MEAPIIVSSEDAAKLLIKFLRDPCHGSYGSYGYDLYLPHAITAYFRKNHIEENKAQGFMAEFMPYFYAAAWDLCRRGILRPGVNHYGGQATGSGNAGDGYSITPLGKTWLLETNLDDFVPTEPERFGALLAQYKTKLGAGFHERGQQAIRCYDAHAYLACCAMCGAAAESIILALAIAKINNEDEIINIYSAAGGRLKIENLIIGQAKTQLREEYKIHSALLKYWRDESAHGRVSSIGDNEAYTSLVLLLRFAMFISNSWEELSKNEK